VLWQRVLSALVLIPPALVVIWYGGWPLVIVLAGLIALAQWELNRILVKLHIGTTPVLTLVSGSLFLLGAIWGLKDFGLVLSAVMGLYLGALVFKYPRFSVTEAGANLLAALYTGWFFSQLYLLRNISATGGFFFLLFLLVCNWASDTGAYFTGRSLGKTRLAPEVSPKKSVEGAVGGIAGATLAALALKGLAPEGSLVAYGILGALISVVGQLGDLAESALKRYAGIKDSSNLIPGHGGVLDRFDSVLLTAPLAYYYISLIILPG